MGRGIKDAPDTVMTNMEGKIPANESTAAGENGSPNDFDQQDRSRRDLQAILRTNPVGAECREAMGVTRKVIPETSSQPSAASSSTTVSTELTMKLPEVQALSSNSVRSAVCVDHSVQDTMAFEDVKVGNATMVVKVGLDDATSSPTEETVATEAEGITGLRSIPTSAVTATVVSRETESTVRADKENPRASKVWPTFSVPDPM